MKDAGMGWTCGMQRLMKNCGQKISRENNAGRRRRR